MRITRKNHLLILLGLILSLAFFFVSYVNYRTAKAAMHREIASTSLPLLRENISSEIQRALNAPLNVAGSMANDSFLKNWVMDGEGNIDAVTQYLGAIQEKNGYFSSFFVSATSGKYYHYRGVLKEISRADAHDVWYYNFVESGLSIDLDVDTDEASEGTLTIFINCRLEDFEGNLLGVTGVGLKMEDFSRLLHEKQAEYNRSIFLVDSEGLIQAHSNPDLIENVNLNDTVSMTEILPALLNPRTETFSGQYRSDSETILITSRYIADINWFLIVEQSEAEALKPFRQNIWNNLITGLLTSILIVGISIITINFFQKQLEQQAVTDELTRLPNRRYFSEVFRRSQSRFLRYGTPLSLVIIDIDHFKTINDTAGHLTGDQVLQSVSKILVDNVRPGDIVARWGGDEFVVLLEFSDTESLRAAERLRSTTEEHYRNNPLPASLSVTLSIGIAPLIEQDSLESLIARADEALYKSKSRGRNCVTLA